MPPRQIVTTMLNMGERPASNSTHRKASGLYKRYMMDDFPQMIEPIEGAAETLEELSQDYQLALNTAADREVLFEAVMPRLGIDPKLFDSELVWTADETPTAKQKPDPYAIRQILRDSGMPESRAIMVGDSQADVLAAYFAGVEPVVPLTGNLSEEDARFHDVKYIIEDITHIKDILPRAIGRVGLRDLKDLVSRGLLPRGDSYPGSGYSYSLR